MKTKTNLSQFLRNVIAVLILNFLFLFLLGGVSAQDIHFSQFYNAPLTMNPALTGVFNGDMRAQANYKNQWANVASPYKTTAASFDMNFYKNKWNNSFLGAGLFLFNDKAGNSERVVLNQLNFSLAYNVFLSDNNSLSAGIQGGFAQRSVSSANIKWGKQYNGYNFDPTLPSGEIFSSDKFSYGDFSAGINWNYGKNEMYISGNNQLKANAGMAIFHVNKPIQGSSDDKLYMKLISHGNVLIGIKNTAISIVPSFLYMKQGPAQEITIGSMVRYMLKEESKYTGYVKGAAISFGGHYRFKDAFVVATQMEVANYAIGLSYDTNISQLRPASNGRGGVEISLRYINPNPFSGKGGSSNPRF